MRRPGALDGAGRAAGPAVCGVRRRAQQPAEAAVRAAVQFCGREGCDGLVAVGGGGSIDLAKGVAIAAKHDGPLVGYATIEGGSPKITAAVPPLIAEPTAGAGSEVARGAIIIVDDGRKLGCSDWPLRLGCRAAT